MLGVIAGSGFMRMNLEILERIATETPFGETSSPLLRIRLDQHTAWCIARHGLDHTIAPHEVNYRANVWALRERGVRACIGLNWVGGIVRALGPGQLALPAQIIDYTHGRATTFGGSDGGVRHIDFSEPFDSSVRGALAIAMHECGLTVHGGIYGVTQGPRLETAAEIDRLERDGCAMVGMTAMPEAALAREAELPYAILAAVVNYAAGRAELGLHEQMVAAAERVTRRQHRVLVRFLNHPFAADL
jgi:purine nucleoside phosphorylase